MNTRARIGMSAATALLSLAVCGCESTPTAAAEKPAKPGLHIIAIDGTRSYNFLDRAKALTCEYIKSAEPGSVIVVRWITADSYQPDNSIITDRLGEPRPPEDPSSNPFDPKGRLDLRIFESRLTEARNRIIAAVTSARTPGAGYTDPYGFLLVASERIRLLEPGQAAHIVIASDMRANRFQHERFLRPDSLKGASVRVIAFEQHDPQLRGRWERKFSSWGALSVRFSAPDEPLATTRDGDDGAIASARR